MSETVDTVRLAKILDVTKMAVSKAIANGRLKKSVRKIGTKYEIDLVTAILEFYQNADLSQDRGDHRKPLVEVQDLLEMEKSRQIKEHYQALLEKLEYEKQTNVLLDRAKTEKEIFEAFRNARDRLLAIPIKIPEEMREQLQREIEKTLEELSSDTNNIANN